MSTWKGKSKGTPFGYRIFIWFIKTFGLRPTYALLRFVTFYYYLFAKSVKKQLRLFYRKVPGIKEREINKIIRRNFNALGESIIDRMAYLIGKGDKITYTNQGEEYLKAFSEKNEPLVIISAHLGNWEIAGNFLQMFDKKINVVMFDGERERLKKLMNEKVGQVKFNIIPLRPDMSHIYKINKSVKNGETICIHGDRFVEGARTIEVEMFGKKVELPYGPFQIAARLKAHHCFIFSQKNAKFNYHFTSTEPKVIDSPELIAKNYAKVLEEKVKETPEQWYNYHPFFKEDADREK